VDRNRDGSQEAGGEQKLSVAEERDYILKGIVKEIRERMAT